LTDTVRRRAKPGRPKGAGPDLEAIEEDLNRLIERRAETQAEANREAQRARSRVALRQHNQRTQNRLDWINHHDQLGRQHQHLADEHYASAARLKREAGLWE